MVDLVYIHKDTHAVDRQGNVISFNYRGTGRAQVLKPVKHSVGYLRQNVGGRMRGIHVLVAWAFIDNPEGKPEVDHMDGDKKNNNVENLRWVTHKENIHHYMRMSGKWDK